MKPQILVTDDDAGHRQMLHAVLSDEDFHVKVAANGREAVQAVENDFFDLILMDLKMPDMDGIQALEAILALSPQIPIIIMTAYASVETAIKAIKKGAYDYLNKPLDIEELKLLAARALRHHQIEAENRNLLSQLDSQFQFDQIIGNGPVMQALFEQISLVAPSEATVLITGESGTGKELVAGALHHHSPRKGRAMVKVNCAALPETMLESELFGHTKGAFTGALQARRGRFQQAHGSTLFLDEIGEVDDGIQAKLLRAIQEKEVEPLGSERTVTVDVRIIAASNKDLRQEVKTGRFREDLFYRLNVIPIEVPPLRRRKEDIPALAEHFLRYYADKNHKQMEGFTSRAMDALMRHEWPGNVRELENLVERAVILTRTATISMGDFPSPLNQERSSDPNDAYPNLSGRSLKEMEEEMIRQTLVDVDGNRTRAAKILGISRRTLQLKLKAYGIN